MSLWHNHPVIISGLDECGRGSLAGPLVGAIAIINIPANQFLSLINTPLRDSKKLSEIQRNKLYSIKDELPITYFIESISVEDINERGISWANSQIFINLFEKLNCDQYLVDGNLKFENNKALSVIKGDNIHPQIMLASVIAKVYRDSLMTELHVDYPEYHWDKNSGYGCQAHQEAIRKFGPTPHHRTLFIRNFV